jgi:hypothetical protein
MLLRRAELARDRLDRLLDAMSGDVIAPASIAPDGV